MQLAVVGRVSLETPPRISGGADSVVNEKERQILCNSWLTVNRQNRSADAAVFS